MPGSRPLWKRAADCPPDELPAILLGTAVPQRGQPWPGRARRAPKRVICAPPVTSTPLQISAWATLRRPCGRPRPQAATSTPPARSPEDRGRPDRHPRGPRPLAAGLRAAAGMGSLAARQSRPSCTRLNHRPGVDFRHERARGRVQVCLVLCTPFWKSRIALIGSPVRTLLPTSVTRSHQPQGRAGTLAPSREPSSEP